MARPVSEFPTVPNASLGGVTFSKHTLSVQAEQLSSITRRIGSRLNHWMLDGVRAEQSTTGKGS